MTIHSTGILDSLPHLPEKKLDESGNLAAADFTSPMPFIVRGMVRDWPVVKAAQQSSDALRSYLLGYYSQKPVMVSSGPPEIGGRVFYKDDMSLNIKMLKSDLREVFSKIAESEDDLEQLCLYVAAANVDTYFPGLLKDNPINLGGHKANGWAWMGTRTQIAPHNDSTYNLACVVGGRRRFVVFPPDQFRNLYLGPIDNTPAGRTISMVDARNPDFEKFPRFKQALEVAQVADLEPGDAIYMPPLWWHHVDGLEPFNMLLNFWWRVSPKHIGLPAPALDHAILSIRDLSQSEKKYWRDMFDYYVFDANEDSIAHIPKDKRGLLGPITPQIVQTIRAKLKGYFQR
ncbi:cupin-like domain-containing protein [Paraglaciecola marina]|uniref:cupin-like domain-containing protein n=1 Tax=Paraglaciecola marina TaxID=2500157 RepID=UPI00105E2F9D|nr:cupin-like domain-containing protein [Paraglaciecola marina]